VEQHPASGRAATSGGAAFDERLSVPLWWYLPVIGVAVLLAAEIHMGYPGIRSWIGYAVLVPLAVFGLWRLGRTRVRVADDTLRVGGRTVPLSRVGHTDVVPRQDKQVALGPELDPTAYLMHRPWVGPVVRVEILPDPAGPGGTDEPPYWIFSVRRTDALLAALDRR
jgi:hypothetical protein